MDIDKTTLNDLSVFRQADEVSVLDKLDLCSTTHGSEQLRINFSTALSTKEEVEDIQQTIKLFIEQQPVWPKTISNGTVMVVEKFFDSNIYLIPANPSALDAYAYKLLHGPDYALVTYSAKHCFDFIKGFQQLLQLFSGKAQPAPLKKLLTSVQHIINKPQFEIVSKHRGSETMTKAQQLHFAHFIRYNYKHNMLDLVVLYAQVDAWYGMAKAMQQYKLVFPGFVDSPGPVVESKGLYHLLVNEPVAYDVLLNQETNFLFLTGANMAGKSTFIKSVGIAVFLAHIGMGVPAQQMKLTFFDGMLSNINVVDNITRGESYFYNEVQRIRATIQKISNGKKWLILIDELFKGTNVQDAMKCSSAVIEGLLKIKNSLFILSTHLYEIGEELKKYPNISFKYFETSVADGQLLFSYHLKDGISNDRLGYLILKREGVVEMLERL
ncbi:MAG TPA: DNA mismatch repair protein MutS [Chitinophagaceae bacterium]|nr:DNA mismatch repair protein MutS [Chitinophagaceae bacterium]